MKIFFRDKWVYVTFPVWRWVLKAMVNQWDGRIFRAELCGAPGSNEV